MDDAIRRSVREGDPLRTAALMRRAGEVARALAAFEALWAADGPQAAEAAELLLETVAALPPTGRLAQGERVERLAGAGYPGAVARRAEWFLPALQLVGWSQGMRAVRAFLYDHAAGAETIALWGEDGVGHGLAVRVLHALSGRADLREVYARQPLSRTRADLEAAPPGATLYLSYLGESETLLDEVSATCARRDLRLVLGVISARAPDQHRLGAAAPTCVLPPLRERFEDLPELLAELLRRAGAEDAAALDLRRVVAVLRMHDWPGNVRELANRVSHAVRHGSDPQEVLERLSEGLFGLPGEVSARLA